MSERVCLIVDDEPAIRSFLRAVLEQQNLRCVEAENPTSALKVIQGLNCLDLLVSDLIMPGDLSGLDLAYSVRNTFPKIPVILISGYLDNDGSKTVEFDFIAKPFGAATIVKAVEKALGTAREEVLPVGSPRARFELLCP